MWEEENGRVLNSLLRLDLITWKFLKPSSPFQLIISSDGTVGMCYEHSPAEGVAVVRLAERALARAEVSDRPAPPPVLLPAPQPMKWNLSTDLQRTIEHAARDFDR